MTGTFVVLCFVAKKYVIRKFGIRNERFPFGAFRDFRGHESVFEEG